jgi:Domain of unknown function (DUF4491)
MNFIGIVAALTAFFSIWLGHVAVRKVEFISPRVWIPTAIFATLGVLVEILSLPTVHRPLSTAFGILGFTLLFDALEFTRQQNRVKIGHAPANPNNPRHAKILTEHSSATTLDLLKRDPIGHIVSTDEANQLVSNL